MNYCKCLFCHILILVRTGCDEKLNGKKTGKKNVDCQVGNGAKYKGDVNVTIGGRKCQNWNSQDPHEHGFGWIGAHNKCRNPDGEPHAWCYTMDDKRWEFCDIQTCNECDKD